MELSDLEIIAAVLAGETERFEELVRHYQPRVFATARRYAKHESEVEDIVQEVFLKAYQKLGTFRAQAPFEHWLMRLAVRTCYDFLRAHQRKRESALADLSESQAEWLERFTAEEPDSASFSPAESRELVHQLMAKLTPPARLVITLLELEERSVREVAEMTGWSVALVKVRAFRARAEMRKCLERMRRRCPV